MKPIGTSIQSYGTQSAITTTEYTGLQAAYDFFNGELFAGCLPDVFITYQRKSHSRGYFSANRFSERAAATGHHELALNPDAFFGRTDEDICSTLVHEMVHVWQEHCGTPPSRGYHNKQWTAQMKAVGLYPSNTGAVGGKETGVQMTHYIIPGGRFAESFARLAANGWRLNLQSAMRAGDKGKGKDKTKFTCPVCREPNWWGKPDARGFCGPECGYPQFVPVKVEMVS